MPPTVINARPGDVYRARLITEGAASFAGHDRIVSELEAIGFNHVWAWSDADDLPKDWTTTPPPDHPARADDVADLFETQWFVQVQFGDKLGGSALGETTPIPTDGSGWRLHDWWFYMQAATPQPQPPGPQPTPPGDHPVSWYGSPDDDGDYPSRPPAGVNMEKWAKNLLRQAFVLVMGKEPTPQALQTIQAVTRGEGYYGWAGKPKTWAGHHNWGAIMCGSPKKDAPPGQECKCGFGYTDGYYVHGVWQPFKACFAHRDTNIEGAIHFIEVLVLKRKPVQAVMDNGIIVDFARAMRDTTYFCRTTRPGKDGRPSCQAATNEEKQRDAEYYAKSIDYNVGKVIEGTGDPRVSFNSKKEAATHYTPPDPPIAPRAPVTLAGIASAGALLLVGVAAGAATALANRKG